LKWKKQPTDLKDEDHIKLASRQYLLAIDLTNIPGIISTIFVPSVYDRPKPGSKFHHPITYTLSDIILANNRLIEHLGGKLMAMTFTGDSLYEKFQSDPIAKNLFDRLQCLYNTLHSSAYISKSPCITSKRSGNTRRGWHQLIAGPDGWIKQHMMGHRIDYSARGVIVPDVSLATDEIGLSYDICTTLTTREHISFYNSNEIYKCLEKGYKKIGGASSIVLPGGRVISLQFMSRFSNLPYGTIVNRYIREGDIVLCNRYPTLTRTSMLAHRVKVRPDPKDMVIGINPVTAKIYNGDFDGDEMTIYALQDETSREDAKRQMHVHQHFKDIDGRMLVGFIQDSLVGAYKLSPEEWDFPPNLCYSSKDGKVQIVNGKLISGRLTSVQLGTSEESIFKQPGMTDHFDRLLTLCTEKCKRYPVSLGISDLLLSTKIPYQKDDMYTDAGIRACGEQVLAALPTPNLSILVLSGAKGKLSDCCQLCVCVGEQTIDDEHKVFIENSFVDGLTPTQFLTHAIVSRAGMLSTSLETADSGYLQKMLSSLLVDC
jgi:hypothetical protein